MTQATDPRYRSSRLFGRLWRGYLKPHAGLMVLAFLFLMADGATLGLLSAVLEPLFDQVFTPGGTAMLRPVGLAILGLFVVRAVTGVIG